MSDVINLDSVAAKLNERGVECYVEMTGGGVATIYFGTHDEEGFYQMAAGPGTFMHRDYGFSAAYFEEFCCGPDGDADPFEYFTEEISEDELVSRLEAHFKSVAA